MNKETEVMKGTEFPRNQPDDKKPSFEEKEKNTEEPVRIINTENTGSNVTLRVMINREFYEELFGFLKQKGYSALGRDREGLAILIEFGLAEDSLQELEGHREVMRREGSRYAALSFKTAEYYSRNFDLAKGLRLHLLQNKTFKKRLMDKGLADHVTRDEWDTWDEKTISEFYNRYVFGK